VAPDADAGVACPHSKLSSRERTQQLKRVIDGRASEFRACFNRAELDAGVTGKIQFHFQVSPDGSVFRVRTSYVSFPDPAVQRCALEVFRTLRFAPPAGGHLDVNYPLKFTMVD
jgi:TonB family protein